MRFAPFLRLPRFSRSLQTRSGQSGRLLLSLGVTGSLLATFGAAVVGASSLSTTGCGSTAAGGGDGGLSPAGPPILIGASIPQTGALKGNKNAMQTGLQAAVLQVNALGGILGRQIVVNAQDDESTPTQAEVVAKNLFTGKAAFMLGPVASGQVSEIEQFLQTSEFVDIAAAATSVELTGACPKKTRDTVCPTGAAYAPNASYFFRTVPSDAQQALAVGIFALAGPNGGDAGAKGACTKMDVIHNDDAYGNPLSVGIETYFAKHGGTIPAKGDIPLEETSDMAIAGYVAQVLKDVPDCLVLAMYPQAAASIMQALSTATKPAGWSKDFFVIGTDGVYDPSLITYGLANPNDAKGTSYVNGTVGPVMYGTVASTVDDTRQEYNELKAIYQAEIGLPSGQTDLDPYTSNQYDATILGLLAMQAAGTTTDGQAIQRALFDVANGKSGSTNQYGPSDIADAIAALKTSSHDINYQGASGDVDFDAYGNVIANFLIWQVHGTGFENHSVISATDLAVASAGQ